jgi:glucose/arabinose dehydrogenase
MPLPSASAQAGDVLVGAAAQGDWTSDAPGTRRRITLADLPKPYATPSVTKHARDVAAPAGALPKVPEGFTVARFAAKRQGPRMLRTAPNGDVFVAESAADRVSVLRDADGDGKAETVSVFAAHLKQPFGIAFYPPGAYPTYVYIANTDSVVRYAYEAGDTKATHAAEVVVPNLPGGGMLEGGGHWTRDIVFSKDSTKLFVSIGSRSNASDDSGEARRARILEFTPDGKNERVYATGLRNPVGLAIEPQTGQLWTTVNERDELGDNLVPDYITHVTEQAFYGWPWFYLGDHVDPHYPKAASEHTSKVTLPDVLVQSHSAALGITFYAAEQFPSEYRGQAFAALHGSWNRERRTGYKVIRIPLEADHATGEYVDFMTGFVNDDGSVWGRPVGVAVAKDGALLVSDDVGNVVWRVAYTQQK